MAEKKQPEVLTLLVEVGRAKDDGLPRDAKPALPAIGVLMERQSSQENKGQQSPAPRLSGRSTSSYNQSRTVS